ncbi:hypothetical protein JDV02_000436 [Purpureocillium takamizusanense]|uniref:Uncharacterized protein n=1 Tax=Purpureocillium takamizusanense TaxID=2060973 RepID=A0A9Q8Q665_9HYPO|nr:uncharacterized protein JDV02_000436 [Purpureocillium takamizusanense]UNI13720.1 hypothetical protein JDV02_000436 [Purpureocillium takamizusanense]
MALSVEGKHALVTGAGSGISLAFARRLLQEGCSVVIGDLKLGVEAEALLKSYPHPPTARDTPSVVFHETDVTSWPQLASLFAAALATFPTLDIVVPGAGLYDPPWSSFWQPPHTATNPDSASRDRADSEPGHYAVLDVNLVAPIRMSQLAIGHWTKRKERGCIVHVGSVAGYLAEAASPLYFASKHGLHGFVRSLGDMRDELGIRVSCVAPGPANTGIWYQDPGRADEILQGCKWLTVEEIVHAMLELVIKDEYGNGTILEVTPGETRVVPMFNAQPPKPGAVHMPAMGAFHEKLFHDLRTKGLGV